MKHTPRSLSWPEELEAVVFKRCKEEQMTRSEYVRKCIREEAGRAHAKRLLAIEGAPFLSLVS